MNKYLYAILAMAFSSVNVSHASDDFYDQIGKIMQPAVDIMRLREACSKENDEACIKVGVDPNDPCRAYLMTTTEQYACRLQECNNGNQQECSKIQEYNERMRIQEIQRQQCESNPYSVWNGSFCQQNMR